MEAHTLATQTRTDIGKGANRKLRTQELIPAVFYGPGTEPTKLSIVPKQLTAALMGAYRRNQLLKLDVGGKTEYALVHDVQVHPVTRRPLHVDLYRVALDEPVTREVPLQAEGRAKGVVLGGELSVRFRSLPVRAVPEKIPSVIMVDASPLDIGESVTVAKLALADGVSVALPGERIVVACTVARKLKEEEVAAPGAAAAAAPAAAAPEKGKK
jgi:large subunit ribosomal protein L25